MGTVSAGWPLVRAERRVDLPEFSSPMITMSSFLMKNPSVSLRRAWAMVDIMLSNIRRVSMRPYRIVTLLIDSFMISLIVEHQRMVQYDHVVLDVNNQ